MTIAPELSRPFDVRQLEGKHVRIEATEAERRALAERFGLLSLDELAAELDLSRKGRDVAVEGTVRGRWVQTCAVSGEALPVRREEPMFVRFVPAATHAPDEEIELDADDCDEIEYTGTHIDLGEAVAQTLGLAIDPYLTGPNADDARKEAGLGTPEDNSPFAALKGLASGKPD